MTVVTYARATMDITTPKPPSYTLDVHLPRHVWFLAMCSWRASFTGKNRAKGQIPERGPPGTHVSLILCHYSQQSLVDCFCQISPGLLIQGGAGQAWVGRPRLPPFGPLHLRPKSKKSVPATSAHITEGEAWSFFEGHAVI